MTSAIDDLMERVEGMVTEYDVTGLQDLVRGQVAINTRVEQTAATLADALNRREERIAALEAENARLREREALLAERAAAMQRYLVAHEAYWAERVRVPRVGGQRFERGLDAMQDREKLFRKRLADAGFPWTEESPR